MFIQIIMLNNYLVVLSNWWHYSNAKSHCKKTVQTRTNSDAMCVPHTNTFYYSHLYTIACNLYSLTTCQNKINQQTIKIRKNGKPFFSSCKNWCYLMKCNIIVKKKLPDFILFFTQLYVRVILGRKVSASYYSSVPRKILTSQVLNVYLCHYFCSLLYRLKKKQNSILIVWRQTSY